MKAALLALALALAGPVAAADLVAVPALDFNDTSGEPADPAVDHAALLDLFAATLRSELAAPGTIAVVEPACSEPCSPVRTPFAAMAEATERAGADRLLVGNIHKISTLIGTVKLTLIDLPADRVLCTRTLTYRGDTEEAWTRAARFAAEDVLTNCLP
jgi:Protein of unknown function (DUF2380)